MPVTIQQATRTVTLLDGLYPLIKLSHITDTWVWLIYTNEGDQLGSMHNMGSLKLINLFSNRTVFPSGETFCKQFVYVEYKRGKEGDSSRHSSKPFPILLNQGSTYLGRGSSSPPWTSPSGV